MAEDWVTAAVVPVVASAGDDISVSLTVCAESMLIAEDSLPKRGWIVVPDTISFLNGQDFPREPPLLFLVPYYPLPAEVEVHFLNLEVPMIPALE